MRVIQAALKRQVEREEKKFELNFSSTKSLEFY